MDNVKLSQEQIDNIATHIFVSDVLSYIENNRSAYEKFLEEENGKEDKNYDDRATKTTTPMGKLELSTN